jgi:bile acid:Na+ symporter, BASS family
LLTDVLLPLGLAVIMGSLGLSLTPADFKRIFVAPKGVFLGLANLFFISPLLAFAAAEVFNLEPVLAVGLVLMGAAPGGVMANLLTHLARGETALSITLTGISSLAATVTVPLYLHLAINHFDANVSSGVSMLGTVALVFGITVIPLSIGMAYRARNPRRAIALEPHLKRWSLAAFVLIIIGAVVSEWGKLTESFGSVAPATFALSVSTISVAFILGRLARLPDRQSTAISLELGLHNATLIIAVAVAIDERLAIPAAVYSGVVWFTALPFARFMARRNASVPTIPADGLPAGAAAGYGPGRGG